MSLDDWAALNQLLDAALDLPPEARAGWIDTLGPEHAAVKPRLRRLLAASDARFTLPRFDDLDDERVHDAAGAVHEGRLVGPYRLIRQLAQGGMGAVWLAERADHLITRRVALKLPIGIWQRTALLDRMAREREILSRLEHRNIGRLYDTGVTDSGQPYLALEYIEGRHINDYCETRALSVSARLDLFLQVLDAVAHAHARLIVHRDLKPSNILVTEDGEVKLLDFGIAKLLTEGTAPRTELTEISGQPLTPEYASPEQVAGEPLTIGSDVYSLGVVLYELLTGVKPRKLLRDAGGGVAAAMHEPSPTLPSVAAVNEPFRAKLRGDLDTIVLKALKRAPAERYATVHAFADDLRRHAQGLPILARPDSAWYRVSKFARRHAVPMAAAAAVLVAVLAGAGVAVWQARVARAEQQRAEEVKEFIASIFEGASPYAAAGQKLSAVDLLQQARARIDHIDDARPELRTELLTLVGSSLAELMEMKDALTILRETVDEATRTLGPDHELTLRARTALSLPQRFLGDPEQVAPELDDLLQRLRASPGPAEDLVEALESHADVAMKRARWDAAEASSREMLAVAQSRLGERHPLALSARWSLVQSLLLAGKNKEAAAQADEAYPLMVEAYRSEPKAPVLIEASELYGRVLTGVGRLGEGISYIARAMDDAAALFGRDSVHIGYYGANLAARQLQAGEFDAALASVDRGLAVSAVVPGPDSGLHAFSHHVRGRILLAARKGSAAVEQLDLAIEKLRSAGTRSAQRLAAARSERALALAYTGAIDEALADLHALDDPLPRIVGIVERLSGAWGRALASQRKALGAVQSTGGENEIRSSVLTEMGLNQLELGDLDAAAASLEEALALSRRLQRRMVPDHADILVGLGRVALMRGRPHEALPLLEEADAFWRQFDGRSRWAGDTSLHLSRAYGALGRHAEEAAARSRATRILEPETTGRT